MDANWDVIELSALINPIIDHNETLIIALTFEKTTTQNSKRRKATKMRLFCCLYTADTSPRHTAPPTSFLENFIFIQFIFAFQNSIKLKSLRLGGECVLSVNVLAFKHQRIF